MAKIQQTCLLVKLLQISFCQTATDCRNHMCFVFLSEVQHVESSFQHVYISLKCMFKSVLFIAIADLL